MTELKRKVVRRTREAPREARGRRLVVILEPGDVIGFRRERTRHTVWTTLACCYSMAVKQEVAARKAAKAKARAEKRAARGAR